MDIHSLMNSEPAAGRDPPKRTSSQAPQPPPPSQSVQHQQQQLQLQQQQQQKQQHLYQHHRSPLFTRGPSDHHGPPSPHQPQQHQHPGPPQHHQLPPQHPSQHQHPLPQHPHAPSHQSQAYAAPPPHRHLQSPARSSISGYPPAPPPLDTRSPSISYASSNPHFTPVRTPQAQTPGPGHPHQYPFPTQFQSPVQSHSHRNIERIHASTPARSASHSHATPQAASPSGYPSSHLPLSTPQSNASATPPSAFVHSPRAVRESPHPLANSNHSAGPYQSLPSTPLGPPPPALPRDRSVNSRPDTSYSQHHRTLSGASNSGGPSIASNSPGPPQRSSSQVVESPATYGPPPAQIKRRSTEHIQQRSEREHSMSVSPKTQVKQGYPASGQRHSSQDAWSARTSISQGRQELEVRHPSGEFVPPSGPVQPATLSRQSTGHFSHGAPSPLSKTHSFPQQGNPYDAQHQPPHQHKEVMHQPMREMSIDHISSPHPISPRQKQMSEGFHHEYSHGEVPPHKSSVPEQRPMMIQQPISRPPDDGPAESTSLKRRAEESPAPGQEQKKPRIQFSEPPPWARLHPSNPGYHGQIGRYPNLKGQPNSAIAPPVKREQRHPSRPPSSSHGHPPSEPPPQNAPQVNGHQPPPDNDSNKKAFVSRILGMPWELSVTDTLPADRLLHQLAEFLYRTMLTNPELGAGDPRNGSLEIEAKIGTLVDRNTNDRLNLPVTTPCLLDQGFSKSRVRFESFMTENQHKTLNNSLNEIIKRSMDPRRVSMQYKHRYEQDSFAPLSQIGHAALPPCAHHELEMNRPPGPLRLRTTHDNDPKLKNTPKPVLAQIVKIRLADRDIICPQDPFDVRISVNIEIDFHGRTDIDPAALAVPQSDEKDPDRFRVRWKDRLSYTHLTNSIDLTQVTYDASGAEKTHELEVELDARALREQALALKDGRENAFEALVEKFWADTLLLVRVREEGG